MISNFVKATPFWDSFRHSNETKKCVVCQIPYLSDFVLYSHNLNRRIVRSSQALTQLTLIIKWKHEWCEWMCAMGIRQCPTFHCCQNQMCHFHLDISVSGEKQQQKERDFSIIHQQLIVMMETTPVQLEKSRNDKNRLRVNVILRGDEWQGSSGFFIQPKRLRTLFFFVASKNSTPPDFSLNETCLWRQMGSACYWHSDPWVIFVLPFGT